MIARNIPIIIPAILVVVLLVASCRTLTGFPHNDENLSAAWTAWRSGDLAQARVEAKKLIKRTETADAGKFMLALVDHVSGDHNSALNHFENIDPAYPWHRLLIEPMLWSYVFAEKYELAIEHAERYGLGQVVIDRIRLAQEHPLTVEINGTVELPFTSDELSSYMPGIAASIGGVPIVARLDTGGAYLHLSTESAARFGIETIGCDTGFASLTQTRICYGVTDIQIGSVSLENVPVAVHEVGLSAAPLAKHFNSPMDAIIGTNILEQFYTTIDGPNNRIIFSDKSNSSTLQEHRRLISEGGIEVPFGVWTDHLMIARGQIGDQEQINFFVDSGLVMATPEDGQVSLLISRKLLERLGIKFDDAPPFTTLPGTAGLSGSLKEDLLVYPVAERTWRGYGDWGGIDVAALIGWGYLKHYSWTLDFERRVFILQAAE
jgi:hypothetical protein